MKPSTAEFKTNFRIVYHALNDAGYFVNVQPDKKMMQVMSHNPDHPVLSGVICEVSHLQSVVLFSIEKIYSAPDNRVVVITFK